VPTTVERHWDWRATKEKRFVCLDVKESFSSQPLALDVLGVSDQTTAKLAGAGKALKTMAYTDLDISMLLRCWDLCPDGRLAQRGRDAVGRARGCYRESRFGGLWVGILDVFLVVEPSFVAAVVCLVAVFVPVLAQRAKSSALAMCTCHRGVRFDERRRVPGSASRPVSLPRSISCCHLVANATRSPVDWC